MSDEKPEPSQDAVFFKEVRKALNLTLREAAEKAGISNSYLFQVESGDRGLPEGLRQKLMRAYGLMPTECPNCDEMRLRVHVAERTLTTALMLLREDANQ